MQTRFDGLGALAYMLLTCSTRSCVAALGAMRHSCPILAFSTVQTPPLPGWLSRVGFIRRRPSRVHPA